MTEFTQNIETIRQYMEVLRGCFMQSVSHQERALTLEDVFIALDNLQIIQEQTQAGTEILEMIQEELMNQSEYFAQKHQHYYDMFNLAQSGLSSD